jgi:3-hydroxyisobutyrate dehydrogenase
MQPQVGFIGLGAMGGAIARRLARSGYPVLGCDVFPPALAAFDEPGAQREADPIAVAQACDTLGVCVRTDAQLETLVDGGRLFEALGTGGLFILNSTVAPDLVRRLAAQAAELGVDFIDVGVSGGTPAALGGTLSLFVGGEDHAVARARPILEAMGTVAHLGPVGRGMEGKLLNNLASIANFGMAAAILDLGDALQFDREALRQALLIGSGRSFALEAVPAMLGWREPSEAGYFARVQDLLSKDVHHAAALFPTGNDSVQALVAASQVMLDHLERLV